MVFDAFGLPFDAPFQEAFVLSPRGRSFEGAADDGSVQAVPGVIQKSAYAAVDGSFTKFIGAEVTFQFIEPIGT